MGLPSSNVVPIEMVIFHSYCDYKPEVNSHEIPMKSLVKSAIFASEITMKRPSHGATELGRRLWQAFPPGQGARPSRSLRRAARTRVPGCIEELWPGGWGHFCRIGRVVTKNWLGHPLDHWENWDESMIGKVGMFAQSPIVLRSLGEFGIHHKDLGMTCLVVWNIFSSHPICDVFAHSISSGLKPPITLAYSGMQLIWVRQYGCGLD